jgi:hypothetical protein
LADSRWALIGWNYVLTQGNSNRSKEIKDDTCRLYQCKTTNAALTSHKIAGIQTNKIGNNSLFIVT